MIEFTVLPTSLTEPTGFTGAALLRDDWNDFSFQTQYHLYVSVPEFKGRIGPMKILRRGQTARDVPLLSPGPLSPLGEEWVSLGQDLDYYERLAELPAHTRNDILLHLRDALAYPDHAATFFEERGWLVSVLRYIEWETFSRDASNLLRRDFSQTPRSGLTLEFRMNGWHDPLVLNFGSPDGTLPQDENADDLPNRIAVIVGRNASGKSTLLSRLARVLHASQRQRTEQSLSSLGTISPEGIGFTRIVNVSYSAFDVFQIPGTDYPERKQIVEELERGTGRYHYCGLRDIALEVRRAEGIGDIDGRPIQPIGPDRQESIILKTNEALTSEFAATISGIRKSGREDLFCHACRMLASDTSFGDFGVNLGVAVMNSPVDWFQGWSTGHKIVMHITASLVAFTEPNSIVLIDEPESHLHPPLLAALMHAIRLILRHNDAFAVVATHSPVVVQETLRRHVAVVRRTGTETRISSPRIETYGESIGEITNEIFGLTSDATDFHRTLSELVGKGLNLESIEGYFDRGLSLQARAFVMSEIARRAG